MQNSKTISSKKKKKMKVIKLKLLSKHYKEKCTTWMKKYMKTDFSTVIFCEEYRAIMDGSGDWTGWYFMETVNQH